MSNKIIDVRDLTKLSEALTQILFFVEDVNALGGRWIGEHIATRQEPRQRRHLTSILFELGPKASPEAPPIASSPAGPEGTDWIAPEFVHLASRAGLDPQFDPRLIEELVRVLVSPARLIVEPDGRWKRKGSPANLHFLPLPQWLHESIWIYDSADRPGFATRPVLGTEEAKRDGHGRTFYWEEALDPISVLRSFLIHGLEESQLAADHYIQVWLRNTFGLHNQKYLKYTLAEISRRFNELFYGSPVPHHKHVHAERSTTLGVSLLVREISHILDQRRDPNVPPGSPNLRRALGIFLFLRFCRQLRFRYYWRDSDPGETTEAPPEEEAQPRALTLTGQCVSALRPLEYTYFQTRMFGGPAFVPGLNYIFRGGLLPKTDSGRTLTLTGPPGSGKTVLALQMMSDMARCGQLALYFSFEESYDSIIDRLVTFGLYDPEKFEVLAAGLGIGDILRERASRQPRRGLLLLYTEAAEGQREQGRYSLLKVIEEISEHAGTDWRWRALTIDSINALKLNPDGQDSKRRISLQRLIETIDRNRFLGVVLREQGQAELDLLSYLADTVVELGVNPSTHMRWIEVKKCRNQDYQPGPHPFRILDARGVSIYPSLSSRMSSLRRRIPSTLSERRMIPFPPSWKKALGVQGIWEKSSTLIWGPAGTGKSIVLLSLGTEPSVGIDPREADPRWEDLGPPVSILMVTFGTSELEVLQGLRKYEALNRRWRRVKRTRLRWYSPGENFTADQIVSELWASIQQSRREGLPIERIIFDETEVAETFLPALRREALFWPTLHELTSTEAITSFFVSGSDNGRSKVVEILEASMDYVLRTFQEEEKEGGRRWLAIEKTPALWSGQLGNRVELQFDPKTGVVVEPAGSVET